MSQPSRRRDKASPLTRRPPGLRRRWRLLAAAVAVGVHLLILFAFIGSTPNPPLTFEPNAVTVTLVEMPPPPPPPAAQPVPAPSSAARSKSKARPRPAAPAPSRPVRTTPSPLSASQTPAPAAELTEAQLAGATTAGSGGGSGSGSGGACDMVRRLQNALRRDYQVQAAVAEAHHAAGGANGAVLVWNGDWIKSASQDGKGLAGVRQAIIVEVGFAPKACRIQPVHGLVLISLNDAPGSPRIALGAGDWRWSDLLFAR